MDQIFQTLVIDEPADSKDNPAPKSLLDAGYLVRKRRIETFDLNRIWNNVASIPIEAEHRRRIQVPLRSGYYCRRTRQCPMQQWLQSGTDQTLSHDIAVISDY